MKCKTIFGCILICFLSSAFICNKAGIKPGENRLTIDLKSEKNDLNAQANVYFNKKFLGMTDQNGNLVLKLQKGEYAVRITLEGYEPWEEKILIIGNHKQNIYPNLQKSS